MLARNVLGDTCSKCVEQGASIYCLKCMDSFCQCCDDSVHSTSPFHDRLHNGNFLVSLERLDENNEVKTAGRTLYSLILFFFSYLFSYNLDQRFRLKDFLSSQMTDVNLR